MPVLLRAARGRGQLAGLELAHGNCNAFCASFRLHTPAQASTAGLQNTRKKGSSLSFSGGGKVTAAARGISSDWGLVSALLSGGHFTFCAEAEKCQELGMGMRKGWRKVARCWGCQVCCRPGHLSSFLRYTATSSFSASPLVITNQN